MLVLLRPRSSPRRSLALACVAGVILAPATPPALARASGASAGSDIAVQLRLSGGARDAATLADRFVMPVSRGIANDSCGVWYRDATHAFYELSVRFDQIQIYSSPVAPTGLRLMVDGYRPATTSYTNNGLNTLMLRLHGRNFDVDLQHDDSTLQVSISHGGHTGSFVARHYSRDNGPGTVTVQGTWSCARLFRLKYSG